MATIDSLVDEKSLTFHWQYRVRAVQRGRTPMFRFFDELDDALSWVDTLTDFQVSVVRRPVGPYVQIEESE